MEKNKETLWLALYAVLLFSFLWPLGEYFSESEITQTLASGFFGGIAGLTGYFLYRWTRTKSKNIKIIVLVSILVICISLIKIVHLSLK